MHLLIDRLTFTGARERLRSTSTSALKRTPSSWASTTVCLTVLKCQHLHQWHVATATVSTWSIDRISTRRANVRFIYKDRGWSSTERVQTRFRAHCPVPVVNRLESSWLELRLRLSIGRRRYALVCCQSLTNLKLPNTLVSVAWIGAWSFQPERTRRKVSMGIDLPGSTWVSWHWSCTLSWDHWRLYINCFMIVLRLAPYQTVFTLSLTSSWIVR